MQPEGSTPSSQDATPPVPQLHLEEAVGPGIRSAPRGTYERASAATPPSPCVGSPGLQWCLRAVSASSQAVATASAPIPRRGTPSPGVWVSPGALSRIEGVLGKKRAAQGLVGLLMAC